jgi:zinc/manganese transport system substrate-binding protein/manganese/iron transport system substrate-binding protein
MVLLAAAFAGLLVSGACGGDGDGGGDGRLRIVATTSILADWLEQVGGDAVNVEVLVPENADPHTFTLTPSNVRTVNGAAAVFVIGAGLEAPFIDAIRQNATGPVVDVSGGLPLESHGDDGHDHGVDSHYWMNPRIVVAAVDGIAAELEQLLPESANTIRARATTYQDELRSLDGDIEATLAALPAERRFLVTFHDAYGYLADRYGLTILGFVVENPDEEPSASALADLINAMKENHVQIIFKEPQFSARIIEQLASDTGAQVRELPSAALSSEYPTYAELMRTIAGAISD